MEVACLQRRFIDLTATIFQQEILDSQFTQLQQLQDESSPNFIHEVVSLFFQEAEKLLNELSKALDQQIVDFKKVDAHVHRLKGSSASIGARRVKDVCIAFRSCCEENNKDGCIQHLQQVNQEYYLVKSNLEDLLKLEKQILASGGSIPTMK
ncbi:histidine-containing phosphotransfer protein 1 [Elaeis guineensis]|uniref:Histidine-containing phosphotransfer protein n=1 Tax=Elaeis guineensis var. tenera TaxID=51953 RepID=A0A8N4EQ95_ELAGV|nr:histidine-containing phosphotransfer protein 1 [Elaeis guineensis]